MTNKRIQLSTNVDGQNVNVYPVTKSEFVEFSDGKTLNDKLNNMDGNHEHGLATPAKDGFMSKEDKAKLDGVNNYTHPSTHAATMITEDATHRFVTDAEKTKWDNKADTTMASKTNAGLMSASDKQRIDGLNAEFKTRDDKITKNTEDIKSWNNEMINKEYQYFNGENITIENSIVSKTTDMVIKGRTLVNLGITKTQFKALNPNTNNGTNLDIFGVKCCNMLKPNTKYTIYITGSNKIIQGYITGLGMAWTNINTLTTFTTINEYNSETVRNVMFKCTDTLTREEINNISIMILEEEHTAIPCYFEGLKSFGEEEKVEDKYKISILSHGKNLCNLKEWNIKEVVDNKEVFVSTGFISPTIQSGNPILLKLSKKVSKGVQVSLYSIDKATTYFNKFTLFNSKTKNRQVIYQNGNLNNWHISKNTVTSIDDFDYVLVDTGDGSSKGYVEKIQISFGGEIIDYEPYKQDKKDILIKEPLHEGNYLYEDNGQVKVYKKKKKYTFTGDEDFGYMRQTDKYISFYCNVNPNLNLLKSSEMICNNFCFIANRGQITEALLEGFTDSSMDNRMSFSINKSKLTTPDVEGFKAWLKANPTEIIYQLATPVTEVVENCVDIDLKTFKERSYVTSNNVIKGELNFTAPMNTAANLENNSSRLNNIENYIDDNKNNIDKISKLEEGAVTSSLNIIDLQKEIKNDNDYTHYEGTNITIDNLSKNSRTSNMLIKGRTYHNLIGNIKNDIRSWVDKDDKYSLNLPSGKGQPPLLFNLSYQLKANQKYTVISEMTNYSSGYLHFSFMNENGNVLASTTEIVANSIGINKFVFTIKDNVEAKTLRLLPRSNIDNIYTISKKIMILEGDWTNKEIPSHFEGINSVGETELEGNQYKINILSSGENLFDGVLEIGSILSTGDNDNNTLTRVRSKNYIDIKKLSTVYISSTISGTLGIRFYDYNKKCLGTTTLLVGNVNSRLDLRENTYYIRFSHVDNTSLNSKYIISEKGINIDKFQPYQENRKNIFIKEPLRGFNENICDIIYEDNDYIKVNRKVKRKIFNGNEDWVLREDVSFQDILVFRLNSATRNEYKTDGILLSNNFDKYNNGYQNYEGIRLVGSENYGVTVGIYKTKLSTQDSAGFKKYLENNNLILYCEETLPVVEIIENCVDLNLAVFKDQTYISSLNAIKGILSFNTSNNLMTQTKENNNNINKSLDSISSIINKTSKLESAQLSTALNVLELQKHTAMLNNGEINEYSNHTGTFIECNNTLDSRTEGMKIKGRTLVNLVDERINFIPNLGSNTLKVDNNVTTYSSVRIEPNTEYYIIKNKKTDRIICAMVDTLEAENAIENLPVTVISQDKVYKIRTTSKKILVCYIKTTLDESCKICIAKASSNYTEYFEGIKSFGESEQEGDKYKISVLSHGKNLFNFKSIKEEAFDNNSIKLLENGLRIENHWAKSIDFKIDLKPNTKYTSSYNYKLIKDAVNPTDTGGGKLMLHNESTGKYFALTNPKGVGMTFTTPEDIKDYKKIVLYSAGGGGSYRGIVEITNIQIEEGTQATQCEPYKCDKKDILLKEQLRENDVLYEDNGQVKVSRKVKQYLITGNETIIVSKTREKTICFNVNFTNDGVDNSLNVMCNNFLVTASCYSYDVEGFFGTKKGIFCSILKSKLTTPDIEGFKAWLKANPTKIIYQLAEPTTEIIDSIDINVDTYKDKTYITTDNEIQGELEFKTQNNFGAIMKNVNRCISKIFNSLNNILNIKGE